MDGLTSKEIKKLQLETAISHALDLIQGIHCDILDAKTDIDNLECDIIGWEADIEQLSDEVTELEQELENY